VVKENVLAMGRFPHRPSLPDPQDKQLSTANRQSGILMDVYPRRLFAAVGASQLPVGASQLPVGASQLQRLSLSMGEQPSLFLYPEVSTTGGAVCKAISSRNETSAYFDA